MIRSYMAEREIFVSEGDGLRRVEVSFGVPPDLILGPALWNSLYGGLLRTRLSDGVKIIGFAKNVAIIVNNYIV